MGSAHRPCRRTTAALLALLCAGLLGLGPITSVPAASALTMDSSLGTSSTVSDSYNERVLALVNKKRAAHGLRALKLSTCVSGFAKDWSQHLVSRGLFEHSDLSELQSRCGVSYAAEALGMVWDGATPRDLVSAWMHSTAHRHLLLSPKARLSGISVRWDATRQSWLAAENFARR